MKMLKCRMKKEGLGSGMMLWGHKNVNHKEKGQEGIPPDQGPLHSPKRTYSCPPDTTLLAKAKAYSLLNS